MKNTATMKVRCVSQIATAVALAYAGTATAQTAVAQPDETPAEEAGLGESGYGGEIIVTGSRIERAGFDQPTPTTVVGSAELRQGARPSVAEVLNDLPQVRPISPATTNGNTASGGAPVDLRGLGTSRTLTLLNGRRFVGNNNLNYVPMNIVERVEVVTGGASAAYGSDAVAGVVNIILKDKVDGLSVGAITGISSRGDGGRYGADLSYGTSFAGGNGRILLSGEYINNESIKDRNSRPNLGSAGIVRVNPTDPNDNRQIRIRDVNLGNVAREGLITSGLFAGYVFNNDGTLRPFRGGTSLAANPATTPFPTTMIGGEDGVNSGDAQAVTAPLERITAFARASYDLGSVTVWAEGSYGRSKSTPRPFLYNIGLPKSLTFSATNPFLSQSIRDQLTAAGQTSFSLGQFFDGPFELGYSGTREQMEGAIGVQGSLGGGWTFDAHYSHGEASTKNRISSPIISNFNNALDAVSSDGQIVCAINADTNITNDDPACRPLNLFGRFAYSQEALDYVLGTMRNDQTNILDAAAAEIQGDLFSLWSDPIAVALGVEARFEEQKSVSGELDLANAFGSAVGLYRFPVEGRFNVKEAFGEIALPLLDVQGTVKIDLNGAARYSDYSRSGGIWSWKYGGTALLFDALTLRATQSRDIRAPNIDELFAARGINVGSLVDLDSEGRAATNPAYNPAPLDVRTYTGGNPDLVPEISRTTTFGFTFSPDFIRGFNVSVDYYDIKVAGAIARLNASNLTLACRNGSEAACARITRDATGTVTEVQTNSQNIAAFETKGIDFEASYLVQMSSLTAAIPGTLRVRGVATYVKDFIFDTGVSRVDTAGDVGAVANAIPEWRGVLSFTYQDEVIGLDARLRYIGEGKFNHLLDGTDGNALLVNNDIGAYTYFDLGAQVRVMDRFTLFGNVNNVFDRQPPLAAGATFYDVIGTYFTAGVRVEF